MPEAAGYSLRRPRSLLVVVFFSWWLRVANSRRIPRQPGAGLTWPASNCRRVGVPRQPVRTEGHPVQPPLDASAAVVPPLAASGAVVRPDASAPPWVALLYRWDAPRRGGKTGCWGGHGTGPGGGKNAGAIQDALRGNARSAQLTANKLHDLEREKPRAWSGRRRARYHQMPLSRPLG